MPCSILIPTHNRPIGLRRAVQSAVAALPMDGEIIVVDDHSTPPPAIQALADLDLSNVRVLSHHGASGAAAARNTGLAQARGDVIFFLDDDDEIAPGYCDHILDTVLRDHPQIMWGYSHFEILVETQAGLVPGKSKPQQKAGLLDGALSKRLCGFSRGFWMRRAVFTQLGPIEDRLATNEDTEYCLRLAQHDLPGWYTDATGMVIYRRPLHRSDTGHVTAATAPHKRAEGFLLLLTRYETLLAQHPKTHRRLRQRFVELAAKANDLAVWRSFKAQFPKPALYMAPIYHTLRLLQRRGP